MTRTLQVPGDKSISHRALLLAALAEGESTLIGLLPGADCRSTAGALRAMGVELPGLPEDGSPVQIRGVGLRGLRPPAHPVDCGNSGTTARLLMGLLGGMGVPAVLDGDASLRSRPMRRITHPLTGLGVRFAELGEADRLPIEVMEGPIADGWSRVRDGGELLEYRSPVASAQVKSALLLAGLGSGRPVSVVEPLPSRDHTERMLRRMGVRVESAEGEEGTWRVTLPDPIPRRLAPLKLEIPGDLSSAAFLLALGVLGGGGDGVRVEKVGVNPTRTGFLKVLDRMGAAVHVEDLREAFDRGGEPAGTVVAVPGALRGVEVGGAEVPSLIDELPLIAALGARAEGVTVIRDAEELRVKESDRIRVMCENLRGVGVEVEERPDGMAVTGGTHPLEGKVDPRHDHRIAMAFGVLGALPGNRIEVTDRRVVDVSFPGFWELLEGR